jgi:hypothetical protein
MVIAPRQQNFYYDMAQKPHTSKGVESRLRIPVTPDTPGGRVLAPHFVVFVPRLTAPRKGAILVNVVNYINTHKEY